jgi:hypothetical protein
MSLPQQPPLFREGYALLIGVSEYADAAWNAPTAERDARRLAETLADPQLSAYPPGQVELLAGAQATREAIVQALGRTAARVGPDDIALIVFTGHGALGDDGLYYLASSDTRFVGEQIARGSGVSVSALARALRDIAARRILLIINACASGNAARLGLNDIAAAASAALPEEQSKAILETGEGRAILTASRAEQRSYFVAEQPLSFFGQALIDSLRGGGVAESGGYVGLFELYNSLHRQVRRAAQRMGLAQEPTLTVVQAAGPFAVARYPGADSAGDPSALQRGPASDTASGVRPVSLSVGQINVSSSNINVGGAGAVIGDVTIGDIAGRDINTGTVNLFGQPSARPGGASPQIDPTVAEIIKLWRQGADSEPEEATAKDPREQLPLLANRLAQARNVDPDQREDAAQKLRQAARALNDGDSARVRQRLGEAIVLMRDLDNPYVNSIGRKVAAIFNSLG